MLAPEPERGRVFEHSALVGPADVDAEGRAHLDAIAGWLQDAAFADLVDAGLVETAAWIVRRTLVQVERRPEFCENLSLRTFCSGTAKSVAGRRTSIRGDRGARIEAEATWVQVDQATRTPTRLGDRFFAVYGESAGTARAGSRLRHPGPPDQAEPIKWEFRAADIDLAGHVNNTVYWQIAEQHLPGVTDAEQIEIEFRDGAGPGPATVLRAPGMLWVLGRDRKLGASIRAATAVDRRPEPA